MRYPALPLFWILLMPLSLLCGEELSEAVFEPYLGRWVGEFNVHSTATGYSEVFPVEQRYWMKDGVMHGVAVLDRSVGMQTSRSETVIVGGQLRTKVTREDSSEEFFGKLHEGGVVWFPTDLRRVTDYQLTERFVLIDGVRTLQTEGFDSYVFQGGLAHIVYRGSLRFTPEVE